MTKILYHDMTRLYHDNNIYHDIVIFFIKCFYYIKIFNTYHFHNPCHQCQYQTNTILKREKK